MESADLAGTTSRGARVLRRGAAKPASEGILPEVRPVLKRPRGKGRCRANQARGWWRYIPSFLAPAAIQLRTTSSWRALNNPFVIRGSPGVGIPGTPHGARFESFR
jgi:hypothetical protein